jgi:hypothetical protein
MAIASRAEAREFEPGQQHFHKEVGSGIKTQGRPRVTGLILPGKSNVHELVYKVFWD